MEQKRLKVALIGLNFGQWVIENEINGPIGRQYVELIGVCDLDAEKTKRAAERFGVHAYESLDAVLADPQVEAVVLITGPVGRAAQIEKILRSGRPVMTTKPFETSPEETLRVLRLARELHLPVFMNSPSPLPSPDLRQMLSWVKTYGLGRPVGYRATVWCSYREKPDGSWYDDPALCPAAPVFRLGIYLLNDLCRFVGPVKQVDVLQSRVFTGRPTADNAQLSLLHEDGTIGCIYASFCVDDRQYYRNSLELNFERGTIWRSAGPNRGEEGIRLQLAANTPDGPIVREAIAEPSHGYPWEEFFRAVAGETIEGAVTPEQTAWAIRILEQMKEKSVRP